MQTLMVLYALTMSLLLMTDLQPASVILYENCLAVVCVTDHAASTARGIPSLKEKLWGAEIANLPPNPRRFGNSHKRVYLHVWEQIWL